MENTYRPAVRPGGVKVYTVQCVTIATLPQSCSARSNGIPLAMLCAYRATRGLAFYSELIFLRYFTQNVAEVLFHRAGRRGSEIGLRQKGSGTNYVKPKRRGELLGGRLDKGE